MVIVESEDGVVSVGKETVAARPSVIEVEEETADIAEAVKAEVVSVEDVVKADMIRV